MASDRAATELEEFRGYKEHQGIPILLTTTDEQVQALTKAQHEAREAASRVREGSGTEKVYDLAVLEVLRQWFLMTGPESMWREICLGHAVNRLLHTDRKLEDMPDLKAALLPAEIKEIDEMLEIPLLNNCEIKESELRRILEIYQPSDINFFDQKNLPEMADLTDMADEGESLVMDAPSGNRLALLRTTPHDPRSRMLLVHYQAKEGLLRYRVIGKGDLKFWTKDYDPGAALPMDLWLVDTFMNDSHYREITETRSGLTTFFLEKNMGESLVKKMGIWEPTTTAERPWSRIG